MDISNNELETNKKDKIRKFIISESEKFLYEEGKPSRQKKIDEIVKMVGKIYDI